jgi:hypothetical protein
VKPLNLRIAGHTRHLERGSVARLDPVIGTGIDDGR